MCMYKMEKMNNVLTQHGNLFDYICSGGMLQ